jgi:hypothetical protein
MTTHFHNSDERFCGSRKRVRKFTFDPNAVTCHACKSRDRLWLTPQGQAYVDSLKAAEKV